MRLTKELSDEENRKWPIGNRVVTWPMTSPDPKRSSRDPNALKAQYLETVGDAITIECLLWDSTVDSDSLASWWLKTCLGTPCFFLSWRRVFYSLSGCVFTRRCVGRNVSFESRVYVYNYANCFILPVRCTLHAMFSYLSFIAMSCPAFSVWTCVYVWMWNFADVNNLK